jgi:uncharacterized protein (TIGR02996 family)
MPTDSMRLALETALRENPDDLAAHMAYGDYLAERGDPRGEFAQVQLALENAKLPPERRAELRQREAELLAAHQAEWLGPLANLFRRGDGSHCVWARGWLDEARIRNFGDIEARLLRDCPAASLLRSLELPHVRHLLRDQGQPDVPEQPALERLARQPSPPRALVPGLSALKGAVFLPQLRHLQIGPPEVGLDEEGPSTLGSSLALEALLGSTSRLELLAIGAPGVRHAVLFSARLPHLHTLSLHHEYGQAPLRLLAANTGMPALRALRIHPARNKRGTLLESEQVVEFAQSPHFPALRELHLRRHNLDARGCQAFVDSGILLRLRKLDLSIGTITDRGARVFARCRDIRRLESFTLLFNALSEVGIAQLEAIPIEVACSAPDGHGRYFSGDLE